MDTLQTRKIFLNTYFISEWQFCVYTMGSSVDTMFAVLLLNPILKVSGQNLHLLWEKVLEFDERSFVHVTAMWIRPVFALAFALGWILQDWEIGWPITPTPRKTDYHGIRDYCGERYMVTAHCSQFYLAGLIS